MIYFDNAATTYPKPECVYKALDKAQRTLSFNAGRGMYQEAENANCIIEDTRKKICERAKANSLIFTASATHALNQIIHGIDFQKGDIVYCSPYDHNAIVRTLHSKVIEKDIILKLIPLNDDYSIDLERFKTNCILDKPKAIFASHVSNVTGYVLPITEIGEIASLTKSIYVVDGAQAFGLIDVDMQKSNISYYVFAGHKTMYGPFGIAGYLYVKNELDLSFYGGTGSDSLNVNMPIAGNLRYEPSSPNVVAIAGLDAGFEWITNQNALQHEKKLVEYTLGKLKEIDDIIIYNNENLDGTGIISFNLNGYNSEDLSKILATDYHIDVRGGYHCCPYIHDYLETKEYMGTVRISFSCFNSIEEVDELIKSLDEISLE